MTKKPVAKKASRAKAHLPKTSPEVPASESRRSPVSGGSPLARTAAPATATTTAATTKIQDVVLVRGRTEDGAGLEVLRAKNNELSVGEVRPLRQGQSITGEIVKLTPRGEASPICDVETLYDPKNPDAATPEHALARPGSGRPALVASKAYRDNYDQIWKRRSSNKTLN